MHRSAVRVRGTGLLVAEVSDPDAVVVEGLEPVQRRWWRTKIRWSKTAGGLWRSEPLQRPNIFVDTGLEHVARRWSGVGSQPGAPTHGYLSNGTGAVSRTTATVDGASSLFKTLGTGFGAVATAFVSPSTVQFRWGTTQADLTFAAKKMGLANANTNTSGTIEDVVGGTGTSPYGTQQFTYDATTSTTHNETWGVDVTFDPA